MQLNVDDVVTDPQGNLGVVVSHGQWIEHFGKVDGLESENWPDSEWTGVWYPGEDGLVGQYGDLDRVGNDTDYYTKHPDSDKIRTLLHGVVTSLRRFSR